MTELTDADLLRSLIYQLGLSQRLAGAALFNVHEREFRRWCSGQEIPADVAQWVREMLAFLDVHPVPRWK